ncbi:MAG: hypothetical protein A7316_05110 [Candidatus Altiarchaeales archaeon WOR_SM1_86-2]|nr:MAG: hypothetical protein A7315_11570 [Candidatus Altiarchaeales archaeon WOR_SM1_79]ODS39600.1 MAG: hypothetical protein A7316_05110 [Candidatus Altiarchaeales archaeon WOR_SM1_86-2]
MLFEILGLAGSIIIILIGCELFANGVESVGRKFTLSHAATGSLLAAVGTALPESVIPILALLFSAEHGEAISIGAILGAPFMLFTLAIFLLAVTVLTLKFMGKRDSAIKVNPELISFDLKFFIFAFFLILAVSLIKIKFLNYALAAFLVLFYLFYIKKILEHEAAGDETYHPLHFEKYFGKKHVLIYIQTALGLILIISGAHFFIGFLIVTGTAIGISMLVFSLLITPIATELPEKYNSITWIIRGKDTLALANITGAVAFQSTLIVSIGLLFTEWILDWHTLLNITLALSSAIFIFITLKFKKKLYAEPLLIGGLFYVIYIILALELVKI